MTKTIDDEFSATERLISNEQKKDIFTMLEVIIKSPCVESLIVKEFSVFG
jgi:hypothetical protein